LLSAAADAFLMFWRAAAFCFTVAIAQLFFLLVGLLAIFSSSLSLMPVRVFFPSRLRSSSAPMNRRCFSVFAGICVPPIDWLPMSLAQGA
jgi:hypothetical protein